MLVYTSIVIPRSLLNSHVEVYYEENELTREIIVYDYTKKSEPPIEVYEACSRKCPNETLSEGYNEADPVREESYQPNETPMIFDPVLFNIINNYSGYSH